MTISCLNRIPALRAAIVVVATALLACIDTNMGALYSLAPEGACIATGGEGSCGSPPQLVEESAGHGGVPCAGRNGQQEGHTGLQRCRKLPVMLTGQHLRRRLRQELGIRGEATGAEAARLRLLEENKKAREEQEAVRRRNPILVYVEKLAAADESAWQENLEGMGNTPDIPKLFRHAGKVSACPSCLNRRAYTPSCT